MTQPARGERSAPQRASGRPPAAARVAGTPARALSEPSPTPAPVPWQAQRGWKDARSFAASVGWTLLSTIVPGLGLVSTRWRRAGLALTGVTVALVVVVGGMVLGARGALVAWATDPVVLNLAWVGLAAFGVLCVIAIVATHLLTRPRRPTGWQRVGGATLVGVLSLAVAIPSFVGARTVYDTASLIRAVFQDGDDPGGLNNPTFGNASNPWADKPRLNVLILGGDAGADRVGTRTDTIIMASINTRTGDTVLYSLPRQTLRMPFPAGSALHQVWPNGFYLAGQDEGESMLNAMYDNVPARARQAIPPAKDPGAKVLQISVGEALGLQVDYYAMVNLDGFVELVNALGGITVNINKPVPVGGKNASAGSSDVPPDRWLAPGPNQHLNGYDALWFARGRYRTTDYERMARQRCVIQAVSRQANPANVLANYEALTKAGSNIVATDVPNTLLPALLDLSTRVRTAPLRAISFENAKDGFSTVNPNWNLVRRRVRESLDPAPPTVAAPATAPAASTPPTTPTSPTTPAAPQPSTATVTVTAAPDGTRNVADECAYNPAAWADETP